MTSALFIHHSVGRQILQEGGLRRKLSASIPSLDLWSHDYNQLGLSDNAGSPLGKSFPIPDDNTDPDGLLAILRAIKSGDLPLTQCATTFDVLMLKSCFPNNAIHSDAAALALKGVYQEMRDVAMALPQAVVLVSSPPLVFEATRPDQVERAVDIAGWLGLHWSGPGLGYANIFHALSYHTGPAEGTLKLRYRVKRPGDSHLGVAGAETAARAIVLAVHAVI